MPRYVVIDHETDHIIADTLSQTDPEAIENSPYAAALWAHIGHRKPTAPETYTLIPVIDGYLTAGTDREISYRIYLATNLTADFGGAKAVSIPAHHHYFERRAVADLVRRRCVLVALFAVQPADGQPNPQLRAYAAAPAAPPMLWETALEYAGHALADIANAKMSRCRDTAQPETARTLIARQIQRAHDAMSGGLPQNPSRSEWGKPETADPEAMGAAACRQGLKYAANPFDKRADPLSHVKWSRAWAQARDAHIAEMYSGLCVAYNEGCRAAQQGTSQSSNPFRGQPENADWAHWLTGWQQTAKALNRDAYSRGYRAFPFDYEANPYTDGTPESFAWTAGCTKGMAKTRADAGAGTGLFAHLQKGKPQS